MSCVSLGAHTKRLLQPPTLCLRVVLGDTEAVLGCKNSRVQHLGYLQRVVFVVLAKLAARLNPTCCKV